MSGQVSIGGAITQMTAKGLADSVLTDNPQVTFWRFVAKAYTNFALETQLLDFTAGVPNFGAFPKCNLDRIGDLVYWMYAVFDLPGIGALKYDANGNAESIQEGEYRPYWTRSIGQALIESANFFIGGQNIDYMKGEFLFIWEELTGQPGKRLIEMTGNYRTKESLMVASMQPRRLYVPLPFYFSSNSGLALPLVSLQFHSVAVSLKLRPLHSLLKFTSAAMAEGYAINLGALGVFNRPYFDANEYAVGANRVKQPPQDLQLNIQNTDLMAYIECCYVYLDQRERAKFADGAFEQLMIEHQETSTQVDNQISAPLTVGNSSKRINFELNFNHTVIELFWAARLGQHESFNGQNEVGALNDLYNEWFNFSGPNHTVTQLPIDPIVKIQLRLNNSVRFGESEGRYFRLVQPWQHHTNIPMEHIYCYSFALQPEDVQPSGSCNFSRIDNTKFEVTFDRHLFYGPSSDTANDDNSSVTFMVFATNWNILRFKYGLGGKRFAN